PHATKRTRHPVWLYLDEQLKHSYLEHMSLTPQAAETLTLLRENGIMTVILSTHPHEAEEAARLLDEKVRHFELTDYFDEVYATAEYPKAKAEKMLEVLERHNLTKDEALMVGDSYKWDYAPAQSVEIDAVLINSDYHQENRENEPVQKLIDDLDGLLPLLGLPAVPLNTLSI
ncbi:MAG TPA: HAD hydrolase-like protein, partial [Verrucomicrobiae bacterium]|nr:HAD hydrolase-like protein [Verrucomicrobiae bacterium]